MRKAMAAAAGGKGLDAYIVPTDDPHQSEYVAECFARREFLSGFTGSAGTAVVLKDKALLWTDGRYFLQAENELGKEWTLMRAGLPATPDYVDYLAEQLPSGARVGLDPHTMSAGQADRLIQALQAKGVEVVAEPANLVDGVWGDARPAPPAAPLRVHPLEYAGESVQDKLSSVRTAMRAKGAAVMIVSTLDQVAWLLNVRGGDVAYCPVALSYCVVRMDGATLYVDEAKVGAAVREQLDAAGVSVRGYSLELVQEDVTTALAQGGAVWVDADLVSLAVLSAAHDCCKAAAKAATRAAKAGTKKGGRRAAQEAEASRSLGPLAVLEEATPLQLRKAIKNDAELHGMQEAHLRDGAAMAAFFAWLEAEVAAGNPMTEVDIDTKLIELRGADAGFIEPSFPTIAGAGPNGAIIHYRAEEATARSIDSNTMLLLDSGAQYDCGTTDVTRTMHLGTPTSRQRECYTRVLMGNIGLHTTIFPADTPGFMVDSFARRALWQAGLDYRHGTGHGVGAALNVHEGPQGVSPRYGNTTPLQSGMVVSNEPGYYEDGAFGIRIENLLMIREAETANRFGGVQFYGFEALTLIPIQTKLIVPELMAASDIAWLDAYHATVWERVSPRCEGAALEWLRKSTLPLAEQVAAAAA